MNETTSSQSPPQDKPRVRTSARDPIAEWLDVFSSLLALSPTERGRIRDELEDHLRMRVDDLMILGQSEPEAVRTAVSELGETAELARRFKEARTPNSTRRRIMQTVLIATAGIATFVGAASLWPSPANPETSGEAPALIATEDTSPAQTQPELERTMEKDIPKGTLGEAFAAIGESLGVDDVFVHRTAINSWGLSEEQEVGPLPTEGIRVSKVFHLLNSELNIFDPDMLLSAHLEDDLLEIATQKYFDERSLVTRNYDVSDLVSADHPLRPTSEFAVLRDGIMRVIEPHIWQGEQSLGSIASAGPQISVRAPERVQPMVAAYLQHLSHIEAERQHTIEKQRRNQDGSAREIFEAEKANAERIVANLKETIDDLQDAQEEVGFEYWNHKYLVEELEARYENRDPVDDPEPIRHELVAAQVKLGVLQSRHNVILDQLHDAQKALVNERQRLLGYERMLTSSRPQRQEADAGSPQ